MSITITATKRFGGSLRPADAQAEEALAAIPDGETVRIEITRPSKRSVRMHRLFFSLLNVAAEHVGWTTDQMLTWSKIATGHVDVVADRDGEVTYIPRSISFARMDQAAFNAFFDSAVTAILNRLLPPGTPRHDLIEEVHERIGERRAA